MSCSSGITIYQGADFSQVWRWGVSPLVYKSVSAVTELTPLTMTVTAHGVTDGWSVALTDLGGLDALNADEWPPNDNDDFVQATVVDANTLAFNSIDAARVGTYTSGGQIAYYTPTDLTAATGALNIYAYPQSVQTPVIVVSGTVTIDNTAKTITGKLTNVQTATLTGRQYIYYLLVTIGGVVSVVDSGLIESKAFGSQP